MWGYQRNPSWGWENAAADGVAGLVILALIVAVAVTITVAVVIFREIARIYRDRALHRGGRTATILRYNLGGLLGAWLLAIVLAISPVTAGAGVGLVMLSWCVFLVVAVCCDAYETRFEQPDKQAVGDLDTYLDWKAAGDQAGSNGHGETSEPASVVG